MWISLNSHASLDYPGELGAWLPAGHTLTGIISAAFAVGVDARVSGHLCMGDCGALRVYHDQLCDAIGGGCHD